MKKHLHIISTGEVHLVELLQAKKDGATIIDLRDGQPDYHELVKKIFESDAIHAW